MLARLAFIMRAYKARVGPLETMSIIPIRSLFMTLQGSATLSPGASRCGLSRGGHLPLVALPGETHLAIDCHPLPERCSESVLVYRSKQLPSRRLTSRTWRHRSVSRVSCGRFDSGWLTARSHLGRNPFYARKSCSLLQARAGRFVGHSDKARMLLPAISGCGDSLRVVRHSIKAAS
jgi:hypothetical protein